MRVLITGSNGQLGSEIRELVFHYKELDIVFRNSHELDICSFEALQDFIIDHKINAVINCAAYTAVDKAEQNAEIAEDVNSKGVLNLVNALKSVNGKLIHISTDYVFNGDHFMPYNESDSVSPIGVYGNTKRNGELAVINSNIDGIVIRTSWLYSLYGNNFVKTIARLAKERTQLKVVEDQWGRPTYGLDLAKAVLQLIDNNSIYNFPILHYANQGKCNWKQFADAIINEMGTHCSVHGVTSENYPTLAKRPKFSILDTERVEQQLRIIIPTWQNSLKDCIQILNS